MKPSKAIPLALLFFNLCLAQALKAKSVAPEPLLSEKVLRALNNEISGELAQDYIRGIARFHRLQPSRGYTLAAEWVADQARKLGLADVQIEKYPADGQVSYFMQKSSPAWDVEFAELWIVSPQEEKLTSYAEIPVSIAIGSTTCDVEADLVFVGEGTSPDDYEHADVKGKVVLASGFIDAVARLAVDRYGALGVVTINTRFADDEPDNVSTLRLSRVRTPTFGFGLSHRRGEALKARLLRGEKIRVRATVKAETHPYFYENVVATLPGADLAAEEILLTAHLCHYKPGANDNASGSACLLEIGRSLRRLIEAGKIKKLQRTVRFLWVPEMSGSIAYAARHPEVIQRTVAGINLDMVGQYLNKNNSTFFLHLTPHSRPHYINDLLINLTEFLADNNVHALEDEASFVVNSLSGSRDAFRYRIRGYTGGSDQVIFNDGLIGVPFAFFLVWPDRYYHTSGDQPEQCDPTQLKRSSLLAAAATLFLADDCPNKARRLAGEMGTRARSRIQAQVRRGFELLNKSHAADLPAAYKEATNFISQATKREIAALLSLQNYSRRDALVDRYITKTAETLKAELPRQLADLENYYILTCEALGATPQKIGLSAEEKRAATIIPRRNEALKGPLGWGYLRETFKDEEEATRTPLMEEDSRMAYEVLNFIDGKNSLLDIRNAVSAEFKPVPLAWVEDYVRLLARAGVVIVNN